MTSPKKRPFPVLSVGMLMTVFFFLLCVAAPFAFVFAGIFGLWIYATRMGMARMREKVKNEHIATWGW